jgi:hypothetical protein
MIYHRMMKKYMSPETGGEGSSGATATPETVATPEPTDKAVDTPEVTVDTPTDKPSVEKPSEKTSEKTTEATVPEEGQAEAVQPEEVTSKLAQVSGLVEQAGLTMKEIAEYAKANDGAVDLAAMVALKEKHGEAVASLIAEQIKAIHNERMAAAKAKDQAVYDQVAEAFKDITTQSGEETWKELAGWAKDNVSAEHKSEINKLLAQGGLAAKLATQELITAFKEANNSRETQEADLLEADAVATPNGKDISKHEYNMELDKLLKSGHQYGSSREIAQLDARRMASIRKGIK